MHGTEEGAHIAARILHAAKDMPHRLKLVKQVDQEGWNAFHFACKSGLFPLVNWVEIFGTKTMPMIPIDKRTKGASRPFTLPLRMDKAASLRRFERAPMAKKVILKSFIDVNKKTTLMEDTAFDIALRAGHMRCVKELILMGGHSSKSTTEQCMRYLHRAVLSWDEDTANGLINYADENKLVRDKPSIQSLIDITNRMTCAQTCTFDFTGYSDDTFQYMYECQQCGHCVCVVCMESCHGKDTKCRCGFSEYELTKEPLRGWKSLGLVKKHCQCPRTTCRAMAHADDLEREGYAYVPQPLDTKAWNLSTELQELSSQLARNEHDVWATGLINNGWCYGNERNNETKHHPLLLDFDSIPGEAQKYNRQIANEMLRAILQCGYEIVRAPDEKAGKEDEESSESDKDKAKDEKDEEDDVIANAEQILVQSQNRRRDGTRSKRRTAKRPSLICTPSVSRLITDHHAFQPHPIDTGDVELPEDLDDLVDLLARNSHEVWAEGKLNQGFQYAPKRNIVPGMKLSASLIPFRLLSTDERSKNKINASAGIKTIFALGWVIKPPDDDVPESPKNDAASYQMVPGSRTKARDSRPAFVCATVVDRFSAVELKV